MNADEWFKKVDQILHDPSVRSMQMHDYVDTLERIRDLVDIMLDAAIHKPTVDA